MVQTILYVWLVLSFSVMERQFTEFRFFFRAVLKKKRGLHKYKHQTRKYISEKIS